MAVRRPAKPITLAKTASPPATPAKAAPAPKKAETPAPAKPAAKAAAAKPAPVKTEKPVAKPIEIKAAAPAPKPVDMKPVEAKPVEAKPIEAKSAPAKPVAAKPAEAPVKAMPVAALDMSGVQDNLRKTASKTLEQGRAAFERMKEASDEATHTIEASLAATSKGAAELATRALEVTKINANATFDHLKALAGAKTLAEAMSMHGQFIRAQSEAAVAQAKEFAELAKKAATDAAAPLQAQIKKAQAK